MGNETQRRILEYLAQPRGLDACLGVHYLEATHQCVTAELTVGERHLQPHGAVHGGVLSSLIESTCSVGASLAAPAAHRAVGIENHTSFLGSTGAGTKLQIRATPIKVGRRTQFWQAEVLDSGENLVARGQVRLLCLPASHPSPSGSDDSSSSL